MRRRALPAVLALLALACGGSAPAGETAADAVPRFYTRGMLEPDKLASAWLLTRCVDPGAPIAFLDREEEPPAEARPFDMALVDWSRTRTESTYEIILADVGLEDVGLDVVAQLVRASEMQYWSLEPGSPEHRFDREMKRLSREGDVEGAFAFLDSIRASAGAAAAD